MEAMTMISSLLRAPRYALLTVVVTSLVMTWQSATGDVINLLRNPSFEDDLKGTWSGNGFDMSRVTSQVRHGSHAILCANRARDIDGPLQNDVQVFKGRHYVFQAYVMLLNDVSGKPWQVLKAVVQMTLPDGTLQAYNIAYRSFCSSSQGWITLSGDIEAPQLEVTDVRVAIRGPDPGVTFLVDNVTLHELPGNDDAEWRIQSDVNIETHRKSNIHIDVKLPTDVPASEVDIEVAQIRHWFAFGSLLRDELVREQPMSAVMKLALYLFEWATVQSFKWKYNKGVPPDTNPDFSNAVEATKILLDHGVKVRGHSVFWNVEKNVPDWVKELRGPMLRSALYGHLHYMISLARGQLQHWDLQNEHIAGHYYEETLGDVNITKQLYVMARDLGDTARLYMNEFQSVTSGAQTEQYHDLVKEMLREGIPVQGLGIQGHTKPFVRPSPKAMWRRLDRLAETGLELMMTEFDLGWPDLVQRADWFEDAIRAFFGHPAVRGVILWDFWSETMKDPNHELVQGPDLNIVEAGQRWACLVKKEWRTNVTFPLGQAGPRLSLRAFRGDYAITVRRQGVPVQRSFLALRKRDKTVTLDVTSSTAELKTTYEHDYVPTCISHRAERTLGTGNTSVKRKSLYCRSVYSKVSGPEEDDVTSVSCDVKEVMTGCSSYHVGKQWTREGEKMEVNPSTGHVQCTAHNGRHSPKGVRAYARCCKVQGLSCDYRTAGPSSPFHGAMAEARCSPGSVALGCSAYSRYPDSNGVRPSDTVTSCLAQSGSPFYTDPGQKSGSHAFSACCKASADLRCVLAISKESDLTSGKDSWVVCPSGYVMTGCNVFAGSGKSAGARIVLWNSVERCKAYLGDTLSPGHSGVTAYATCCKKSL